MSKTPGTKSYPAEFRSKAVKLVSEKGFSPQQVAEHLGCSLESVRRWKEAATRKLDPEHAARIELEKNENKRLRKRILRLVQTTTCSAIASRSGKTATTS